MCMSLRFHTRVNEYVYKMQLGTHVGKRNVLAFFYLLTCKSGLGARSVFRIYFHGGTGEHSEKVSGKVANREEFQGPMVNQP